MGGRLIILLIVVGLTATAVYAEEGTVTYYDPSCGFFVLKLPGEEGYGLFEWRAGPKPELGHVLEGDLVKGEEIDVVNKTLGATNRLIHWANAPAPQTLIRNFPFQCTSRWQRRG